MEKKRNLPPESSQLVEPPLKEEQESLPVQEEKEGDQAFKQSSTSTFGKHQKTQALITPSTSFGGSLRFDSTVPTSVRKHMEAIWKRFGSEAMQKAQQPYSKCKTSSFGSFPIGDPIRKPFSILSYPAITEEDGGTSGRTAKLERYESCFAIAGANYCVIAADFTCGQTKKISKLSEKSVMASCGSQADVKALQEALSAKNLVPYFVTSLEDSKIDAEGCKYLFHWLSGQLIRLSSLSHSEAAQLLKAIFSAMKDESFAVRNAAATCIKEVLRVSGIQCHGTTVVTLKTLHGVIFAIDSRHSTKIYRLSDDYLKFYQPCSNILVLASGSASLFNDSIAQMINL